MHVHPTTAAASPVLALLVTKSATTCPCILHWRLVLPNPCHCCNPDVLNHLALDVFRPARRIPPPPDKLPPPPPPLAALEAAAPPQSGGKLEQCTLGEIDTHRAHYGSCELNLPGDIVPFVIGGTDAPFAVHCIAHTMPPWVHPQHCKALQHETMHPFCC